MTSSNLESNIKETALATSIHSERFSVRSAMSAMCRCIFVHVVHQMPLEKKTPEKARKHSAI